MEKGQDEWTEYPLWGRIALAVMFLGGGLGFGWLIDGRAGMIVGGVIGGSMALLALFVPPVLAFLAGVLEVLSYCAF
ncbi:hypothetical protein [Plastoroseomonas arctica]|uniref:Uncharacterized protein n=1 Tax=Plastoroseomonas arctica TaxID=1509237 RepID=A0AAF1KQ86_9PROT|nr:hypothetical protein [Plastoroseomonas arctica]MBR0657193.1 hypothetical protein [Plastoroseomonas arctica]